VSTEIVQNDSFDGYDLLSLIDGPNVYLHQIVQVASLGGCGGDRPVDTIQRVTPD